MPVKGLSNPFSHTGNNDLLYDIFLDGTRPDYSLVRISDAPRDTAGLGDKTTPIPTGTHTTWVVKNVPDYLEVDFKRLPPGYGFKKIESYSGYAIRLAGYDVADSYLRAHFSSRNRRKLRSKTRKLEQLGEVSYQFYHGPLDWQEHLEHFDNFYHMLKNRFDQIGMYNRNLVHWAFFCKNSYERIEAEKAFLLVVHLDGKPIAYSLNYIQDKLVFGIFQTHDTAYEEFNLGDICMHRKLEWCFAHQIHLYDFSYGHNYFKEKWSNYEYKMNHYLFFRKDLLPRTKSVLKSSAFRFRQKLRDWGILGKLFQLDKFFYQRKVRVLEGFNWKDDL